jgi:hypothetical protein
MPGHVRSERDQGRLLSRAVSHVSSQLTKCSGDLVGRKHVGTRWCCHLQRRLRYSRRSRYTTADYARAAFLGDAYLLVCSMLHRSTKKRGQVIQLVPRFSPLRAVSLLIRDNHSSHIVRFGSHRNAALLPGAFKGMLDQHLRYCCRINLLDNLFNLIIR